ncbi:Hypothetical predicted protein, partial [Marmota monax]
VRRPRRRRRRRPAPRNSGGTMSSPPEGKLETKAGHPPAVKAGGMRIVQKHPHAGDTKEEKDKDDQEWESPRWETSGDS